MARVELTAVFDGSSVTLGAQLRSTYLTIRKKYSVVCDSLVTFDSRTDTLRLLDCEVTVSTGDSDDVRTGALLAFFNSNFPWPLGLCGELPQDFYRSFCALFPEFSVGVRLWEGTAEPEEHYTVSVQESGLQWSREDGADGYKDSADGWSVDADEDGEADEDEADPFAALVRHLQGRLERAWVRGLESRYTGYVAHSTGHDAANPVVMVRDGIQWRTNDLWFGVRYSRRGSQLFVGLLTVDRDMFAVFEELGRDSAFRGGVFRKYPTKLEEDRLQGRWRRLGCVFPIAGAVELASDGLAALIAELLEQFEFACLPALGAAEGSGEGEADEEKA